MITEIGGRRTMGFDEEWARLRAEAAERRDTSMRLNQLPADQGGPGGGGKLASTPAEKNAAANTIDTELLTRTQTAGRHADEATGRAAGAGGGGGPGPAPPAAPPPPPRRPPAPPRGAAPRPRPPAARPAPSGAGPRAPP
ncbi:hypothetical protein ACE14D_13200 [Streptomyces sp. Act-28]